MTGYRIIELAGIGPGPYAGQFLADMGAEVIVVERPGPERRTIDARGKKSIVLDLRNRRGLQTLQRLLDEGALGVVGARYLLEDSSVETLQTLGVK